MRTMRAAAMASLVTLAACGEFDAPNQNSSTLGELTQGTPSRIAVATAAQGLLGSVTGTNGGLRTAFGTQAGALGSYGREYYNLDVSNPQNIVTIYSPAGGNSFKNQIRWTGAYATMAQANIVVAAADQGLGMTTAEKEGVKGFAKTIKAIELFWIIRQSDSYGAALDALSDPTAPPPAIASKDAVYTEILRLLDEAAAHLTAAGSAAFPFAMTTGFADFSTPVTFRQFNRGMRAKVNVTWVSSPTLTPDAKYTAALADLAASFIDTTAGASLSKGAYHTFSTLSGDVLNGLYDPTSRQRYASRHFARDAQLKTVGGVRDDRYTNKIDTLVPRVTRYDFAMDYKFKIYNTPTTPAVILKNEELILLRAEANLNLGNTALALTDINTVRARSGGLPPYTGDATLKQPATLLDELLYDRRFSLMYENGDRWVDARRYGRLNTLKEDAVETAPGVPVANRATDVVWPHFMIPINECLPRNPQPAGCTTFPTPVPVSFVP